MSGRSRQPWNLPYLGIMMSTPTPRAWQRGCEPCYLIIYWSKAPKGSHKLVPPAMGCKIYRLPCPSQSMIVPDSQSECCMLTSPPPCRLHRPVLSHWKPGARSDCIPRDGCPRVIYSESWTASVSYTPCPSYASKPVSPALEGPLDLDIILFFGRVISNTKAWRRS